MMRSSMLLSLLLIACAKATPGSMDAEGEGANVSSPATPATPGLRPPATSADVLVEDGAADEEGAAVDDVGVDQEPLATPEPTPTSTPLPEPPLMLECVSAIEVDEGQVASSWRGTLVVDGDASRLALQHVPRFQSHAGVWWNGEGAPAGRDDALQPTGPASFAGVADRGVALELSAGGDGLFVADLRTDESRTRLVCWDRVALFGSSWASRPVDAPFFDSERGECVRADGTPAELRSLPLELVLDSADAECVDLRAAQLNAGDFGDPDIFMNMRGADLTGASLHFASLSGSLEGARLGGLDYGYASVSGSIDDATELPALGECTISDSPWAGRNATCQR